MTETEIRILLNRYYNAETTEAEEKVLTDFFASDEPIPADLEGDRQLFRTMAELHPSADFEQKLALAIDAAEAEAARSAPKRRIIAWISGIAAGLLIAGTALTGFHAFDNNKNLTDYSGEMTAQQIYDTTEMALMRVNAAMSRGLTTVDNVTVKTAEVTNRALSKL